MRKILLDQGFIVSFTDKMKRSIDTLYSEIQVLKESSFELRNSYEALTRYYSSVQYILGSSRLGGYDF
jgi:bisphosphoglycerate-dependent phosphoglycerate mutase